ncbi:MAG: aminotransferase class I/II-fold pyridoxal phosphate-dependent enzyme [Bacteroidota bacterium]
MADFLHQRLAKLEAAGTRRQLGGSVEGIDFWSNDYLGLARIATEEQQFAQGISRPSGATGSRLISGDANWCHELEAMIANHHGHPAALVFNSGYTANLGLLSAVLKRGDVLLYDELMHASCRDGIRLGQAKAFKFKHNELEEGLQRLAGTIAEANQLFVLTEGRFSMDGDVAPLQKMAAMCRALGAHLIVDEAHSGGLEGHLGSGLVAELGLQRKVFATVVTYGKAFGSHGAAVVGSAELREYLINTCRPFIYTTGPAPAQWSGIAAAYEKMRKWHGRAYPQLLERVRQFQELVPLDNVLTNGPIQIVHLSGNEEVMAAELACREAGLLVKGIRSPTVAAGQERLRVCLHAFNTEDEIALLAEVLKSVMKV